MKEKPKSVKCPVCQDKGIIVFGSDTETGRVTIVCPECKNKEPG